MSRSEPADLAAMRAFVAAVLTGTATRVRPPVDLVQLNHLGPIAYRMGVADLRDEYAASMIMAERRRALLAEVVGALASHGVRTALIKGVALLGTIYPDPAERPMHDMDLLVPRTQLPEAMRVLLSIGFRRVGISRKLSGYYHALAFARAGMMVELHRNIVQQARTGIRIGDMWRRAAPDPGGSGAARLAPVDELLICMVHIARHELAVPVINYVDVARLWGRLDEATRAEVQRRAEEYRVARAVAAVLSMTAHLAAGVRSAPLTGLAAQVLPVTDDILRGVRPRRLRQIGQKLILTQGPREILGLGLAFGQALATGRKTRRAPG